MQQPERAGEEVAGLAEDQVQITDLRQSTSTGQWLDISKAAMTGGEITNNPIYTGAIN